MGSNLSLHAVSVRRWAARLAITALTAGLLLLPAAAGVQSIGLALVGLAGLVVTVAAAWWAVSRKGLVRGLAVLLAVAAQATVIAVFAVVGLLWAVAAMAGLWAVAVFAGWAALGVEAGRPVPAEYVTAPPRRPFLVMNPRSGGGKVERFALKAKAEALGARIALLDPAAPQDVAALARGALADGADLLGVAGGDGTQALVASVAAEHDVPFMVIPAGTRNHFALDLGLDRDDPAACLDALTDGVELRVDLGRIGDRDFVNNVSFGAYATVVQSPAYRDDKIQTILRLLPDVLTRQVGPRLTVRCGDEVVDAPQAVLVSNNPYRVGDLAGLGRRERLDSGVLGLLSIRVDNAVQATALLAGERSPGLTVMTGGEVVVDADASEVQVGVDGEALAFPAPVRCVLRPQALRVRVPRHRPGVPRLRPRLDWRRLRELAFTRGSGHA
jgi:diacylglycerol kinase family enzyme